MDALEFAKEYKRMCKSHSGNCPQCDLLGICDIENLDVIIPIVEEWSKEHPKGEE